MKVDGDIIACIVYDYDDEYGLFAEYYYVNEKYRKRYENLMFNHELLCNMFKGRDLYLVTDNPENIGIKLLEPVPSRYTNRITGSSLYVVSRKMRKHICRAADKLKKLLGARDGKQHKDS
jgi:hypothetical protein